MYKISKFKIIAIIMDNETICIINGNVPTFDGDADRFQLWWRKFRAFAVFPGF